MKLWPRSLLGRSVLFIALLLVLANLAWVQIFRVSERTPRARQTAQQIASVVNITRWALITADAAKRFDLLQELSQTEGIQVYVAEPGEQVAPLPDRPFLSEVAGELERELGPDTQVSLNRSGINGVWVSFHMDRDKYWVYLPRSRIERNEPLRWIGWGLLVLLLAASGAYFLVSFINRPLRELTRATAQMARGRTPRPVTETGPSEITSLARAFNHLADDLKRLDDERVLLLAGVSHDLRTPLSRIRLGIEMLDDKGDTDLRTGLVQDIEEIDVAIGQFLDFARVRDAEAAVPDSDLDVLAENVVARYQRAGKNVTCALGQVPPLPLRPHAIQRLLGNLIDNALRYGGGEAEVTTGVNGGKAFVEVCDRGPGIPREEAERMLQPFTRLDAARGGSGTGLGLAIVDRIATMHGGTVQLLPRDGSGLRARVEFPISAASAG